MKISTDGTISFSNAMTLFLPNPASPMSFRELLVGSIYSNNTISLMLSYEKMPTPDIEIACPIEAVRRHAIFLVLNNIDNILTCHINYHEYDKLYFQDL